MFEKFAPVFEENLSFEEKIRFFLREHISFMQKNPKLPLFLMNEMNRHPERIKKIVRNFDIQKLWNTMELQHRRELSQCNITRENLPQFMTSLVSMSIFPFAGRAIITAIMEKMGYDFDDYIEKRKEYAADFVIKAIRKD
jgi:TetR/AcrR family transcriptional regulator